jgi:hypothetical protein
MFPNQTPPAQNVKIRRVRGLAALGVAAAVLVFVLLLAASQPAAGADTGGAYQYAKAHVTLYGKMAALSHHDVLKTTEPLTCSDGVQNFTCLLSKTDITPVLGELKKIGAAPEVSPAARRWVLVLDFNYTEGSWRWRNITVVRGWELKWNNETTYVLQAQIKKSLGEMVKMNTELSEAFFVRRELKNITAVAIYADKIAIGTSNGTTTDGKGKPDHKTTEKIKNHVRKKYGDITVEVYYTPSYTSTTAYIVEKAGDFYLETYFRSNGRYSYGGARSCTLGYLGYLYGDPNLQVIITAWHCFGFVGTDRTSPFIANVTFYTPKCAPCRISSLNGFFTPGPYDWVDILWWSVLRVHSDSAPIGVRDPNFFSNAGLKYGYVRRADGFNDLPIVGKLSKYDVKEGDRLWIRLGYTGQTVSSTVKSLCEGRFVNNMPEIPYPVDLYCHVTLNGKLSQEGDSGSPVYVLRWGPRGYEVLAYGVLSGNSTDSTIVAPIDWIYVKVSVSR